MLCAVENGSPRLESVACVDCGRSLRGSEVEYTSEGDALCVTCAPRRVDDASLDARGPQRTKAAITSLLFGLLAVAIRDVIFSTGLAVLAISGAAFALKGLPKRDGLRTWILVMAGGGAAMAALFLVLLGIGLVAG